MATKKSSTKKPATLAIKWDIKIGDEIEFFDPTLSYELTGYRPITETEGLDFDPEPFRERAQLFETSGYYTTYLPKTKLYDDFWREEYRRCIDGYTVNGYTITGDNYFFLNYYRLSAAKAAKGATASREESFPSFYAQQYTWFHYYRLCELLGKDACALKPRGCGWSELAASMGSKMYTVKEKSCCIYAAAQTSHLTPTLQRVWDELEFLNMNTNGGMRRLSKIKNSEFQRRASHKVKEGGTEVVKGFKSEIRGVVIDEPRKMRGSRVERLFFEEAGSNPKLEQSFIQGEPLVTVDGRRIGILAAWGTGGDEGPQLAGLAKLFYNPQVFNILPYKNNYNQKKETVFTAFFIPAYLVMSQFMDNRGVCNSYEAIQYYQKKRLEKSSDASALLKYSSEFCFYPEEALIREGENRFDSEKLSEQSANIELHKLYKPPIRGRLFYKMDREKGCPDYNKAPDFQEDVNGPVKIVEYPMRDQNDCAYKNLYCIGIDSIDQGRDQSTGQKDVSDFCAVVYRRQLGLQEPKIVAIYKERPKDIRTAYDMAIKLALWYNCKIVLEATRVTLITYLKEKGKETLLMRRPRATLSNQNVRRVTQYGVLATQQNIEHQLDLIDMFVNDYCHTIEFIEVVDELLRYSYVNKRKFDIVAALGMALLGDEELQGSVPISASNSLTSSTWQDIGYYYDNGIKKYGIIPKNYDQESQRNRQFEFGWFGASDIRLY